MGDSYDLRSVLAGALPAVGPTRATVKSMHEVGYDADPKNNDMKELFVGLNLVGDGSPPAAPVAVMSARVKVETSVSSSAGAGGSTVAVSETTNSTELDAVERRMDEARPSAARALLDYRREKKKAAQEHEAAFARSAAEATGKGQGFKGLAAIGGVGMARAAVLASADIEEAADDERYLRKAHLSKTAARLSSKQKRRRKQGKSHGIEYEERYSGKVLNKTRRKGRMLAMKQMY